LLNVQDKSLTANEDNVTLFTETTTQGTAEDNVSINMSLDVIGSDFSERNDVID
jgi:hypothetical protein